MSDFTPNDAADARFPRGLEHRHGLNEWSPMLPERSLESIDRSGAAPAERTYRCQRVGCGELVRIPTMELADTKAG